MREFIEFIPSGTVSGTKDPALTRYWRQVLDQCGFELPELWAVGRQGGSQDTQRIGQGR